MAESTAASTTIPPSLGSRIVVTWAELTVLGLAGGILGTSVGGPPALVVYFATTLLSVGILLYNVNELIQRSIDARMGDDGGDHGAGDGGRGGNSGDTTGENDWTDG